MTTLLLQGAFYLACLWSVWLMARCYLGFHAETVAEQVFAPGVNGKRTPYTLQWRCRRCQRVVARTEVRPTAKLMLSLHRDRKAGKVLQMRKRA